MMPERFKEYGTLNIVNINTLRGEWTSKTCNHGGSDLALYGLNAALACPTCLRSMRFQLRFGRPKTYVVTATDERGNMRVVGIIDAATAAEFIWAQKPNVSTTEDTPDPANPDAERDSILLGRLMETLMGPPGPDGPPGAGPAIDFTATWKDACHQKTGDCQVYSNNIITKCPDGPANMVFAIHGERFHANGFDATVDYGMQDADTVIQHIKDSFVTISLPSVMADKMSDDPERDAEGAAKTVLLLEKHGLLARTTDEPDQVVASLSVMNATRKQFEAKAETMLSVIKDKRSKTQQKGRYAQSRQMLEALRLAWPYRFEGRGINVSYYNPAGYHEFCPRCGFVAHGVKDNDWRRGCRECGYIGYLLDM